MGMVGERNEREDVWRDWECVCSEGGMRERMCGEIGSGYVRREK